VLGAALLVLASQALAQQLLIVDGPHEDEIMHAGPARTQ
jgi:hypothetical protein